MTRRAIVIGWDGATWEYIKPLLKQGYLKNLERLMARGARATLRSTVPPYTNVAWPSLVTGLSPAKTGVYDGARTLPGSYETVPTNLTGYNGTPIWEWVNRYGYRTGILNVPMTYPAAPLEGYLVSGFDSPHQSGDVSYPRSLLQLWAEAGQPYRILAEEVALMKGQNPHHARGDLEAFVQGWVDLTLEQGDHIRWLWQERPVDFLFAVFSGTDSINHRTRDFSCVARVYEAADEALGRVLDVVEEDTIVCLVSDHGSTPAFRYISLYRALVEGGWLRFRPMVARRFLRRLPGMLGEQLYAVWPALPGFLRRLLSWPLLRWEPRLAVANDNIDWSCTKVYALSGLGPLYLNVRGRRPKGIVQPESYERLLKEVQDALLDLEDARGKRLFSSVKRGEDVYPNADPGDDPPDLVFEPASWTDHVITGYPTDPLVREIPEEGEYGTHTPDGILLFAGNSVRAGVDVGPADIVDVVPTLLALMDLPIPSNVDGRIVEEAVEGQVHYRYEEASSSKRDIDDIQGDEADEVMDRLRSLGYL